MQISGITFTQGFSFKGQLRPPNPPTIGTVTVLSNTSANVRFTAPTVFGDAPLTGFTAIAYPGGVSTEVLDPNASNITVTGLSDNVLYTFSVTANSSEGQSTNSSSTAAVLTNSYPAAPAISYVELIGLTNTANIVYTAPGYNGNSAITGYTAVSNIGGITATVSTATSGNITVTGLANLTSYSFTVYAVNQYGRGLSSNISNSIIYRPIVLTVPDAPSIVYLESYPTGTIANVVYIAPSNNGNSTIISYTATSNPGNVTATVIRAGSGNITVGGLSINTTYTFAVTATNAIGTSSSNNLYTAIPVEYLIVAGGGSGASAGSGGGAGGLLYYGANTLPKTPNGDIYQANTGTYRITVGAGGTGPGSIADGTNGSNSEITFNGTRLYSAAGGGYGGATNFGPTFGPAGPGGSGGGAGHPGFPFTPLAGGTGISGQGNPGGLNTAQGWATAGAGGGGAGSAGARAFPAPNSPGTTTGGAGGAGLGYNITGTHTFYAGGGGGGSTNSPNSPAPSGIGTFGTGGIGGGGDGAFGATAGGAIPGPVGNPGTVNTGGGAGGRYYYNPAPAAPQGGSGVVVVRYPTSYPDATTTGNPNVILSSGYKIYRFWQSGNISLPQAAFTSGIQTFDKPGAPTITAWTVTSGADVASCRANISYAAPSYNGNSAITSYTLVTVPENRTVTVNQATGGNISIIGLEPNKTYVFSIYATNSVGSSAPSIPTPYLTIPSLVPLASQQEYTTSGTYSWVAPVTATSVSVVAVGGGGSGNGFAGGGGGGLGWKNNIPVVPGNPYTVVVGIPGFRALGSTIPVAGGTSYFIGAPTVSGVGGGGADNNTVFPYGAAGPGGGFTGDGGGTGGPGGIYSGAGPWTGYGGGGGAGGYSGTGGTGGGAPTGIGTGGSGGAGGGSPGGGGSGGGGGVGIYGAGTSGAAGGKDPANGWPISPAGGGSGGEGGSTVLSGGRFGGGAGNATTGNEGRGTGGAIRIIWGGGRSYPNNAANV
jgi:hypothetical protein